MSDLVVPALPPNMRLPANAKERAVDGDLYNICERIAEVDPNLFIVPLEGDPTANFAIMEHCADGVDRLVNRVKELDARVIERMQYIRHVPFEKRLAEAEKQEARDEADRKEQEFEDLYENIGGPMRHQLWHDGFVEHRDKSYPLKRVKGVAGHGKPT